MIEKHTFIATNRASRSQFVDITGKPWNIDWWKYCDVCGREVDDPVHVTDPESFGRALMKAIEDEEVK